MTTTREELAKLIDPSEFADGYLSFLTADRILAHFDLVPKGSVVVPAVPTAEMISAAYAVVGMWPRSTPLSYPPSENDAALVYRAMIAARPGASP